MDYNLEMVKNFKLIFSTFKKLSDLKINFYKSELFFFGKAYDIVARYVELFVCDNNYF